MRCVPCGLVGFLLSLMVGSSAPAQGPAATVSDSSLRAFLPQFEEATSQFLNGDPALWKRHASQRDDATILGAWGGYDRGWQRVGSRYDGVAARLQPTGTKVRVEYLSSVVNGDLAYTVGIERSEVRQAGQDKPVPVALRVTHIFRRERGVWKLVHRHADPLMIMRVPDSAPEK